MGEQGRYYSTSRTIRRRALLWEKQFVMHNGLFMPEEYF